MPGVSIVVPLDRVGSDPRRCVAALLAQTASDFELILVAPENLQLTSDERVRVVVEVDRNPALRRNRGVAVATSPLLAFIDDDAFAAPDWLERAVALFAARPDMLAAGGADPGPADAPLGERIADMLLATPYIGSGIAAHEARAGAFILRAPHDVALVNLFVRREAFIAAGGFDEAIGYIGEDSDLLRKLMARGEVRYEPSLVVQHRRRPFPLPFLRQRWRYRFKTGAMLVARGAAGASYRSSGKLLLFLLAGCSGLALLLLAPDIVKLIALALYAAVTLVLGSSTRRIPLRWALFIPLFFVLHHATYFAAIVCGATAALWSRLRRAFR